MKPGRREKGSIGDTITSKEHTMSFFKEAGDSLLHYTEIIVNKTEMYAKIGKITLDIKRIETQIQKTQREMGEYVYTKFKDGAPSLGSDDEFIAQKCGAIDEQHELIARKRREIEDVRKAGQGQEAESTGEGGESGTESGEP